MQLGDFVGLKGQVDSYKQEPQINVKYLETEESIRSRGGDLSAFDPELLIQATPYDREALWQELRQLAETEISPPLGPLVLTSPGPLPGGVPGLPRRLASITTLTWAASWSIPGSWPATPWRRWPSIPN